MTPNRIPCPGRCGGEAAVEHVLTRVRGGEEETVFPVRCTSGRCVSTGGKWNRKGPQTWFLDRLPEPGEIKPPIVGMESRVRAAMKREKITQKALSEKLGFSTTTLKHWLHGKMSDLDSVRLAALTDWLESAENPKPGPSEEEVAAKVAEIEADAEERAREEFHSVELADDPKPTFVLPNRLAERLDEIAKSLSTGMISHYRQELKNIVAELKGITK